MGSENKNTSPFIQPRSHRYYNFAIFLTALLVFVFIPLFFLTTEQLKLFTNNGRELQVAGNILFLVVTFFVVVAAYYWFLTLIRLKQIAATHIMFLLSWVTLSGFLLPLTSDNGMFLLRHAVTNSLNFKIVTIASIIVAVLAVSRHVKIVQVFFAIFLAVTIIPTVPRVFTSFEKHDREANTIQLSPTNNLILVGLDGLPGHILKEVLTSNREYLDTFKDFTLYENVSSTSPATKGSLRGIVYGNQDFTQYENPTWIDADELYFNNSDLVTLTTGSEFNAYNKTGKKLAPGQFGPAEQRNQLYEMYRYVVVRIATKFGVNFMDGLDAYYFPDRKGKFYSTVEGFDKTVTAMKVGSDKPGIFYSHFTFTHSPLTTDENCIDRKMDNDWFNENQNLEGLKGVTVCGLKKYTELLEHLKDLDIYQNSTIILLSDHGQFPAFYTQPPQNLKINNGPHMGFDRYQPFLMIKPANHQSDRLRTLDRRVLLDDLAQTTCNLFQTKSDCEQYPGINILDDDDIAPADFYIHVVKDEHSDWSVIDHQAVALSRQMSLLDAMKMSADIDLTEPQ